MSKILDWIKEHVRPYAAIRDNREDYPIINQSENNSSDDIEDKLKKTEIGIKITWKW